MSRHQSRGYILAMVLVTLAVMTLIASVIIKNADRSFETAQWVELEAERTWHTENIRQQVLFELLTSPTNYGGFALKQSSSRWQNFAGVSGIDLSKLPVKGNELPVDGSWVRINERYLIAVEDLRAKLNWQMGSQGIERFLNSQGLTPAEITQLRSELQDYQDFDDLLSLQGAEINDYVSEGLMPPANRSLHNGLELLLLKSWPELLNPQKLLSFGRELAAQGGVINFNTMSEFALSTISGVSSRDAAVIVSSRPFNSLIQVASAIGKTLPLDILRVQFLPSNAIRLSVLDQNTEQINQYDFILKEAANRPWQSELVITQKAWPDILRAVKQEEVKNSEEFFQFNFEAVANN